MRRLRRLFIAVVLALAAVLCLRAALMRERVSEPPPLLARDVVDTDQAARHLSALLQIRTVADPSSGRVPAAALAAARQFIEETYPRAAALASAGAGGGIMIRWRGQDDGARPVLLMAHLDVVPEREGSWRYPPFGGRLSEGAVWGRGALDDKGSAVAILEAVESLLARGFTPPRTLYVFLGIDEERSGTAAAMAAAALRRERPGGVALVLDEGSFVTRGIVPGVVRPVALVGVAEKGYLTLRLTATGSAGHSSVPVYPTTIGRLASALERIERDLPSPRLDGAAALMFDRLARAMPFRSRLIFANLWLFRPLVTRLAGADPRLGAAMRTTIAPTRLEGGSADNVLPAAAAATVNLRLLPGDSVTEMTARVRAVVARDGVRAEAVGESVEPSPVGDPDAPGFRLVARILRQLEPLRGEGVVVAPSLVTGATDARHFQEQSAEVLRFLPFVIGPEDVPTVHGGDERLTIANLALGVAFYRALIEELDALE